MCVSSLRLRYADTRDNLSSGRFGVIPAGLEINKDTPLTEEICRDLPHVTIALLGHFKGETGVDQHLISLANESVSELKTRWWIEKLVSVCQAEGQVHGPAFASAHGGLASSADYNAVFRKYLGQVQDKTDFISGETDVDAQYSTFRTPRKSSTAQLERAGFGDEFVERMNRWRSQEGAKGRAVKCRMNTHYADAMLLMPTTWLALYVL